MNQGERMKMKRVALVVLSLGMATTALAATTTLDSDLDKLSYSIGVDLGKNFKRQGIEVKPDVMAQGMQDALGGKTLLLTDQQMQDVVTNFQKQMVAKRTAEMASVAAENKKAGDTFLSQNKSKPGVVVLPSGLQYKIITAGKGAKPKKDDTVTVEYTGKLLNGSVFDSTEKAGGKPADLKVSQVIPGWVEALQLMPAGSTWELYVPANLAYGERSVGGVIGPNSTLIFTVHLIDIKK